MKLYSYWRSSTSYRARIALNLKGLNPDIIPVNLLKGEQKQSAYASVNTQMRVPTLIDGEHNITQSLAVIEYLEEKYPNPPLLPLTPPERAHVRALSLAIACDISPLNNLGPLAYLSELGIGEEQKTGWIKFWIAQGFATIERMLLSSPYAGSYCHGASPTMADCVLVPQVYNARRFNCDLSPYPNLMRIAEHAEKHPAFIAAHPSNQPDAA